MKALLLILLSVVIAGAAAETRTVAEKDFEVQHNGRPVSVTWKVQESACLLAINFGLPRVGAIDSGRSRVGGDAPPIPTNRVWLLARNGEVILPNGQPMWIGWTSGLGPPRHNLFYFFPLAAQSNAVAVVVNVTTNFVIQPLAEE